MYLPNVFHSVCRSEEVKDGIANSTPTIDCWQLSGIVLEGFDAILTTCTMIWWRV